MLRAPFALLWNLLKLLPFLLKSFFFALGHFLTRKDRRWVRLKLEARQPFGPATGLAARFQDKPSFLELRGHIDRIASDPRIEGVVITADGFSAGAAKTADLLAMLKILKDRDKSLVFHLHSAMGRDFDLAAQADKVLLTPGGRLYLFGAGFDQYFASSLLDRLGVAPQFVHIGPFKTAAHRFIHDSSTQPLRLMMTQLLDSLSSIRDQRTMEGRSITPATLQKASARMPLDDRQAQVFGLVDQILHRGNLAQWLEEGDEFVDTPLPPSKSEDPSTPPKAQKSKPPRVRISDMEQYAEASPHYRWTPLLRRKPVIAAMDLTGVIVMTGMEVPGQSAATIDPAEVLPVLRQLASDPSVAAVVLHINSPGGNALASEILWDGIRRLRWEKPVIAYCSDVAASGGYYLAVACDQIICQPETITGSIGVIAGKFSFPGAFEKLGIHHESFRRNETALFTSISEPLSREVLANLQTDARGFYRQFLRRVGQARQLPRRRLHRYARGRVYTGIDAHRRHLVDHLGGFEEALQLARSLAKLPDSAEPVFYGHRKVSLPALLRRSAAQTFLPEAAIELSLLKSLLEADPLLALMPFRIQPR